MGETITSLVQLEYSGFEGATVPICTFTLQKGHVDAQKGCYIRLSDFRGSSNQGPKTLEAIQNRECGWFYETAQDEFQKVPGGPVAYWVSDASRHIFEAHEQIGEFAEARQGLSTTDNNLFLRQWFEVRYSRIGMNSDSGVAAAKSGLKWFPMNKGGPFRKWWGNQDFVVNWEADGRDIKDRLRGRNPDVARGESRYFRPSVSWSDVTSAISAFRIYPPGFIHDAVGHSAFGGDSDWKHCLLAYCNNKFFQAAVKLLNPTLHFHIGYFNKAPYAQSVWCDKTLRISASCVSHSRADWDAYERSWDFQSLPLLTASTEPTPSLESSYTAWITQNRDTIAEMKRLEEENNRLFIDAYGLADELTPDVPIEQITLTVNPAYRYGGKLTEEEQWTRFRQDTFAELVSYAIGCMMGRYSLDAPGLIYAHSGNEDFDASRYTTFPADDDGIVPLTDTDWFDDDAAHRLIEFISVAWDTAHLEANLTFLADNLSPKKNESSRDTIRRYLCDKFFKDHLQTYKKRPIYWLFASGKQKAFQCLAYLHRYNEGTLSRMRSEYVIPLQGKMAARLEKLMGDIQAATSTAQSKRLEKERGKLERQQVELLAFDEKLRHYADMRINLDLDDGVKVNYGKFGDLLAEVKAVHGKKAEGS